MTVRKAVDILMNVASWKFVHKRPICPHELMNLQIPCDELVDLYPGTGIMGHVVNNQGRQYELHG
jgi:hypothetical protein